MSVLAKDRKESPLRVMTNWMDIRLEFKRLFTFNFGYDKNKVIKVVRNEYHIYEKTDEMTPRRLELFKAVIKMNEEAALKILNDSREFLMSGFRQVEDHMYIANTIYPTTPEELSLRRCHQDEALGICYSMMKELEFIMRSMPVHSEKFPRYIDMMNGQLALLKAWRSSNNRFNNVNEGSSRRRRHKKASTETPQEQSSDSPSTNSSNASPEGASNIDNPLRANDLTSSTTGNAVPSGKQSYSKGYAYSTGYRQPHR